MANLKEPPFFDSLLLDDQQVNLPWYEWLRDVKSRINLTTDGTTALQAAYIDVTNYGTKRDGITDDTAALQAAYDAASNANKISGFARQAIVYHPPGIYQVAGTLTWYPFVNYVGVRSTVATATGTTADNHGSVIRKSGAGILADADTGDMTIRDLVFIDGTSGSSTGIRFGQTQNASGIEITGCRFLAFLKGIQAIRWNDSLLVGNGFESNATDISFDGTTENGGHRFLGNVFFAAVNSIGVANNANVIDLLYVGNVFHITAISQKHISLATITSPTLKGWTFANNTFKNTSGTPVTNAVNITAFTTPTIEGLVFDGNQFRSSGLFIDANYKNLVVKGNTFDVTTEIKLAAVPIISLNAFNAAGLLLNGTAGASVVGNAFRDVATAISLNGVTNGRFYPNAYHNVTTKISGASATDDARTEVLKGTATLVAGTVTVNHTSVKAASNIHLAAQDNNTTGALRVSARVVNTSFTITSSNAGDTGVIAWKLIN